MATALTISSLITDAIPETERVMAADTAIDYANLKVRAIALAKWEVYQTEKDEGDITNAEIKEYLALLALARPRRILDAAIDWWTSKSRRADTKEGATLQYHDRVAALQDMKKSLLALIGQRQERILKLIEEGVTGIGDEDIPGVSTLDADTRKHKYTITPDPWEWQEAL